MADSHDPVTRFGDSVEESSAEYRPVSGWAVSALLLGFLSAAAMVHPLLWVVPVLGIAAAMLALRRIRISTPPPLGRNAALVGLALSIFFGTAAPMKLLSYRWIGRREATSTAERWFDYLRRDAPEKAYQLQLDPARRFPLDDALWEHYREEFKNAKDNPLQKFVANPLIRALLALDGKAQVRLYKIGAMTSTSEYDSIDEVFAVTFDDAGKKKSMLVQVSLEAKPPSRTNRVRWRITRCGLLLSE